MSEPETSIWKQPLADNSRSQIRGQKIYCETEDEMTASWFRDGLTSVLLFILLMEWVRPLPQLLHLNDSVIGYLLIAAIGIFVMLNYLRIYGWLMWPLKMIVCLYVVGYMSSFYSPPDFHWWSKYGRMLVQDVSFFANGQFSAVSLETRAFLFFLGWSLLIAMVQMLMLQRQHIVLFLLATLSYLLILEYALDGNTGAGVIRTVFSGMLLLALLHLPRLERKFGLAGMRSGWPWFWIVGSMLTVSLVVGISWYGSGGKNEAAAPHEWQFLQNWQFPFISELAGGNLFRGKSQPDGALSGYSDDDSRLGGPMQIDDTEVFIARTSRLTYWRGESKSYYDGKGWYAAADEQQQLFSLPAAGWESADIAVSGNLDWGTEESLIIQEVIYAGSNITGFNTMFVGGQIERIDSLLTLPGDAVGSSAVQWNPASGNIYFFDDGIVSYRAVVSVGKDVSVLSDDMKKRYLQLPSSLPGRVVRLAQEVVAEATEPYEQALLMQAYLRANYAYSLDKPTLPGKNEDFVDHFLFVDRLGYCDYFSTAMVVMLRSVGIPARWVKGFAPGQAEKEAGEDSMLAVTVRNRDAHSWVEAYFPESGWMLFDPTPGFGLQGLTAGLSAAESAAFQTDRMGNMDRNRHSDTLYQQGIRIAGNIWTVFIQGVQSFGEQLRTILKERPDLWKRLILLPVVIFLLGALAWRERIFIAFHCYTFGYRRGNGGREKLLRIFERIWRHVFRRYGAKSSQQSIREYIGSMSGLEDKQRAAFERCVQLYEAIRYDTYRMQWVPRRKIAELWKAMMKPEKSQK